MKHQFSMFHGTSNKGNYRTTAQWNFSAPCFHLEIDAVFYSCIDRGVRMNLHAEFENIFMCLAN